MPQRDVIERTETPLTVSSLAQQLRAVGLTDNARPHGDEQTRLGHRRRGSRHPRSPGDTGTLMMVTNSGNQTDPSE